MLFSIRAKNVEFLFIKLHVFPLGVLETFHDFIVRDLAVFWTELGVRSLRGIML